jgi:hypothetical protein
MVTIELDRTEYEFLLTVLRSTGEILNTLMALQTSMPTSELPPLKLEAMVAIAALAERIERQGNG